MPFKKGQSGNPSGRRKIPKDVREFARSFTRESLQKLADIMRGRAYVHAIEKGEKIQVVPTAKDIREAAEALLDRGWGKPEQSVTGKDGGDLRVVIKTILE